MKVFYIYVDNFVDSCLFVSLETVKLSNLKEEKEQEKDGNNVILPDNRTTTG